MLSASVIGPYHCVCAVCLVGSWETTGTNFFLMAVRLPVRERSTRKRRSSACSSSFLLTSDSHMAQVADKLARNKNKSKASSTPRAKPKRKPSSKVKAMKCQQDLTRCAHCSVKYGEASDTRRGDDWVKCLGCDAWFHESCAEVVGVLEEAEFHCRDCVWQWNVARPKLSQANVGGI